jgi:hypothetical protein
LSIIEIIHPKHYPHGKYKDNEVYPDNTNQSFNKIKSENDKLKIDNEKLQFENESNQKLQKEINEIKEYIIKLEAENNIYKKDH